MNNNDPLKLAPTDIAQFVRLDQCQRFLRLRLTERVHGSSFIRSSGVAPQEPPPMMMSGGLDFEAEVFAEIRQRKQVRDLRDQSPRPASDDATICNICEQLTPGSELVLLQPRLAAEIGRWSLTGDVDILLLTKDYNDRVSALIVDVKSSMSAKVEHRLQIAFYARMLEASLGRAGRSLSSISLGVLYRGSDAADGDEELARFRQAADDVLGSEIGYLEIVEDPGPYLAAVDDLVTGEQSVANRILAAPFEEVPFHLTYRCDWCRYNPFCMRWAAEHDDLSLIPYLTDNDKMALRRCGVETAQQLSLVKEQGPDGRLTAMPGQLELAGKLATTWPVGGRLDELVLRARRYRAWKGDEVNASNYLSHRGYGTLPYCDAHQNPNLIRLYIDAQHDNQTGHLYLLGALITAAEDGAVPANRRASVVRMSPTPPMNLEDEQQLMLGWIDEVLRTMIDLAAPDGEGGDTAPIHLIFFNRFDQNLFLDALARHAATILSATPLYDFVTQLAALDSPIATFLVEEIRELRNYPMLSQSLQSVARFLKFDWKNPLPFPKLFHERLFDYTGKFDDGDPTAPGGSPWYTSRSRFDSQIPVEYAYAAWDALPKLIPGKADPFGGYRDVDLETLVAFQTRRLEALEYIASDFKGNRDTTKSAFRLPDLTEFGQKSGTLAQALDEFIIIERFVEMSGWKSSKLAPPERRMVGGQALVVRYDEQDQEIGVRERMAESRQRWALRQEQEQSYLAANPGALKPVLSKTEKEASKWSIDGIEVRLEIAFETADCGLQELLDLSTYRGEESVILTPRWTVDGRLAAEQQRDIQPTPKQMLYGMRGRLRGIDVERDESGTVRRAWVKVKVQQGFPSTLPGGFIFGSFGSMERPFLLNQTYVIDADVNDWSGFYAKKVVDGLIDGGVNTLYQALTEPEQADRPWPQAARDGQRRFLEGFERLAEIGESVGFEESKRVFIADHGEAPILLVQGPPGTGKSFTTAYALFARLQGAMAAGIDFRIAVSCHTHKAIDVVLENLVELRDRLRLIESRHPEIFRRYFDERLLEVPIYRARPSGTVGHGIVELKRKSEDGAPDGLAVDRFTGHRYAVVGGTPNAMYGVINEKWQNKVFGRELADCLVLDEASQLGLPNAIMAALPLKATGRVIVVGDPRQMPPIVKHDWSSERRRTFAEFRAFDSLFLTLLYQQPRPPLIQFAESFRLHRDMAEFLRQEIYRHDGIAFRSKRDWRLAPIQHEDPFVAAALLPAYPLVVVLHDERSSQLSNGFEHDLVLDLASALYDERIYNTGEYESDGFGVVVPHRAQRALLMNTLISYPDRVGGKLVIADTVERFQGDEREVIIFSATESDPAYLLTASGFLLEPRRLNVALSRAKRKLILISSRSVFELFSPDEETFANAQLWRDLLNRTCTVPLWSGLRRGAQVEVWGNAARIES